MLTNFDKTHSTCINYQLNKRLLFLSKSGKLKRFSLTYQTIVQLHIGLTNPFRAVMKLTHVDI